MSRRSLTLALLGIPVIVILAILFARWTDDPSDSPSAASYQPSRLATGALPQVKPAFSGTATFVRTTVATSTIAGVEKRIDKCDGPVAVPVHGGSTVLVAEHDYCGGSDWIGRIEVGQAVALSGPGIVTGMYVAGELRYELRGKAKVSDLPDNEVVLQTCVSPTELVLVGLTRVDATEAG